MMDEPGRAALLSNIRTIRGAPLPWSPTAMMVISFFGGAAAALAIGLLDAARLRASPGVRWKIGLWCGLLLAGWWAAACWLYLGDAGLPEPLSPGRLSRRINNLTGLLAWMGMRAWLEPPSRCFQARLDTPDEAWASPWGIGLALVLGLPLLAALPIGIIVAVGQL